MANISVKTDFWAKAPQRIFKIALSFAFLCATLVTLIWASSTKTGPIPQTAAGYTTISIPTPRRGGELALHLWYPADTATPVTLIAQNALFYGFHGRRDAIADGAMHAVVVLSHGSGGNAERLGWIASDLAARGFIVAAVDHAGTTSQDSLPSRTVQPWERAGDVSDILDYLENSPPLGIRPDPAHIGILGFSLGGGTALVTAGARLSKDAFIAYCADSAGKDDCLWLIQGGVDFSKIDAARYESDLRDPRITAALAVDPALTQAMTVDSLMAMTIPVKIINLGAAAPKAMLAKDAATNIPNATYTQIQGAAHFSFLARCSLFGVMMISVAGDDNICSDRGLRPRDEVQAELADQISAFLSKI